MTGEPQAPPPLDDDAYRYAFEHSPVAMTLTLLSGQVLENDAFCRMLGYSHEELAGRTWQQLTHPDDVAESAREMGALRAGAKDCFRLLKRYLHKDGSVIWGDLSTVLRRDAAGEPLYFVTTVSDVTEHQQVVAALRTSEERLEQSQRVGRMGHYVLDVATGTWTCSAALDDIFGIGPGYERTVQGWLGIVHPAERETMAAYLRDHVLRDGRLFDRDYRIVRVADGAERWVHGFGELEHDDAGDVVHMFGVIEDISARKEVEQALRESEERHRTLFESMAQGVVYHDADGHITAANPAAERIIGLTLDQMRGLTSMDPRWRALREDGSDLPGEEHPLTVARLTGKPVRDVVTAVFNPTSASTAGSR